MFTILSKCFHEAHLLLNLMLYHLCEQKTFTSKRKFGSTLKIRVDSSRYDNVPQILWCGSNRKAPHFPTFFTNSSIG